MEISQELVERCVALTRRIVEAMDGRVLLGQGDELAIVKEARAIVAELDADIIEAREVVCAYHDKYPESLWHQEQAAVVRSGRYDKMLDVQAAYHGIRRGRELAALARSAQS